MELDFEGAYAPPTPASILSQVSEFDIFDYYCSNFVEVDKPFVSELREDKNPGVTVYINASNHLRYKDFADGVNIDCFSYIQAKYNCSYHESLNIVFNDFNLGGGTRRTINSTGIVIGNNILRKSAPIKKKVKSIIQIVEQPFNLVDFEYWSQYGLEFSDLVEYNVFSAKYAYLIKGDRRLSFNSSKGNPIYAYRFTLDGSYSYKLLRPYEKEKKYKWLFSGGSADNIEGYDQLPLHGDKLILTKSLKDCMCYSKIGLPAISLQGEANRMEPGLVHKLLKRFNEIIVNYDGDEAGRIGAKRLQDQYGFKSFFIDGSKDLSDYIKENKGDTEKGKLMITNKLKEIC